MKRMIKIILSICLILGIIISVNIGTLADNPFVTRTVDRYGELCETQDAYESTLKIKNIVTPTDTYTLKEPSDIYFDSNNYLYICDTGNKRIVVLDENLNYCTDFGSTELNKPTGITVRDGICYVADYGDEQKKPDGSTVQIPGAIYLYSFNKDTGIASYLEKRETPESAVLQIDGFTYHPQKIAVDSNKTMYVCNEGSYNGILTISDENRFMSYFAPNNVKTSLWDRIKRFFYGENEKVLLKDNIPTPPTNVFIDDSGYIYTVTKTIVLNDIGDTLKRVNIGGINFYRDDMITSSEFISCFSGDYGNVYAVTESGFIYEYDLEGNVLFIFGGNSTSIDQLGLFKKASGIVVNQNDELIILDKNDNSLQVFTPTNFTNTVHNAIKLYNDGKYSEAKALWEEVLVYNSMTDMAHKGIGMAEYLEGNYKEALKEFKLANAKEEYSEAYWEIRNVWISNNIGLIFGILLFIIALIFALSILNRKLFIFSKLNDKITSIRKYKNVNEGFLMVDMIRHPLDATYQFKTNKKINIYHGFIVLGLIFGIYILSLVGTGFIFNNVVLEKTILLKEAFKILIPIGLFIVGNYLASSLLEGEGTFKGIFLSTMGSLIPLVIIFPFVILVSNVLTYNESFIYYFGLVIMIGWSAILLFVCNKELHNYTGKQMVLNIIMTILLMLVLLIVLILVYLMVAQVIDFIKDIFTEAIFHG